MQEKHIDDYWNVVSKKESVRFVERLHKIQSVERKTTQRVSVVWERLTKVSNNCQTRSCFSKPLKIKKTGMGARRLTGIYLLYRSRRRIVQRNAQKNARRTLQRPMAPVMPCKGLLNSITNVIAKPEVASEKSSKTVYV